METPANGGARAANQVPRRRRGVAARVLATYALVTAAFALVAGWGLIAQREASRQAELIRTGYLPLSLAVRDLVANQDTWNTQLNHITDAKNPKDKLVWFDAAVRLGRPRMFGEVRARISDSFVTSREEKTREIGHELSRQATDIERHLAGDGDRVRQLFEALDRRDGTRAERLRDELVTRGSQGRRLLDALERDVEHNVDAILDEAKARERLAIRLLVALTCFMVLVGVLMGLYTRRVLKPLATVTERAKAVARGDLTPRPVAAGSDEIGELATTFENMLGAIARANEELLAAERLATIGKMAAHVTHEIRNPLSSIALNVELLEEDMRNDDPEGKSLLRAIKNEVERLTSLSEQYLSVARRQQLRMEDEDIGELVGEACEFMRRDLERHAVRTHLDIDAGLPLLRVDEAQIKQALFNVMRNAREAMPNGGTIWVSVKAAAGGGVDVTIDDDGAGIDRDARERLFEPFFTTKGQGTGLGLAITRQIIEAHGGTIACEPRTPRGTRLWIHLPERDATPQSTEER
jgi:two-component system, NtrC family, sensor kinase